MVSSDIYCEYRHLAVPQNIALYPLMLKFNDKMNDIYNQTEYGASSTYPGTRYTTTQMGEVESDAMGQLCRADNGLSATIRMPTRMEVNHLHKGMGLQGFKYKKVQE